MTAEDFRNARFEFIDGKPVAENPDHQEMVEPFCQARHDPEKLRAFIESLGETWIDDDPQPIPKVIGLDITHKTSIVVFVNGKIDQTYNPKSFEGAVRVVDALAHGREVTHSDLHFRPEIEGTRVVCGPDFQHPEPDIPINIQDQFLYSVEDDLKEAKTLTIFEGENSASIRLPYPMAGRLAEDLNRRNQ